MSASAPFDILPLLADVRNVFAKLEWKGYLKSEDEREIARQVAQTIDELEKRKLEDGEGNTADQGLSCSGR